LTVVVLVQYTWTEHRPSVSRAYVLLETLYLLSTWGSAIAKGMRPGKGVT